jgi:HEAT repeat protein
MPLEYQDFDFNFNFGRDARNVDPEVALRQEVFRSLLRTSPDRALDIAAERLKADPADPVVLANLSGIAQTNSTKSLPLLLSIAKTSTNVDARRSAISAVSRSRNGKESLTLLEDLYNGAKDNTDVRRVVVQSIARVSDPGAVAVLARIAKSDPDITIRRTVARSLASRNEPEVNKLLEELLRPTK